jgi:predicted double-glycine peptidase
MLGPLLETLGVIAFAGAAVWAALRLARSRRSFWLTGYFVALGLVIMIGAARWVPPLEFLPVFDVVMADRREFALMGPICVMLLVIPMAQLPQRRQRRLLGVLLVPLVLYFSVLPFVLPAFSFREFRFMNTSVDADGVCLQQTSYDCGPAAAVTALRALGVPAEEGELAIFAHTNSISGTPPDSLSAAINKRHRRDGIECRVESFRTVSDLRGREPVIAIVKFSFLVDHYVTVLKVTDKEVVVGDPLLGKTPLTIAEFTKQWRKCGVVVSRGSARDL